MMTVFNIAHVNKLTIGFSWMSIFFTTYLLMGVFKKMALHYKIFSIPNHRSLHGQPTPVGGGVIIFLIFTIITTYFFMENIIPPHLYYALDAGIGIAFIGWLDDMFSLSIKIRIIAQLLFASLASFWLSGLTFTSLTPSHNEYLPFFGYPLATIIIIWFVNIYNFMDGIDGLAGMQGAFLSLCGAFVLINMHVLGISLLYMALSASILAFLCWNWSPARLFMGDVGSGYLGFLFAVLAIYMHNTRLLPLVFWGVISAVFIFDTAFTLFYRIAKRERWYEAHAQHAYQRLVQIGCEHKTVTISILAINCFVLFPVGFGLLFNKQFSIYFVGVLTGVMFILWLGVIKYYHYTRDKNEKIY